jgi:hypothetical protein
MVWIYLAGKQYILKHMLANETQSQTCVFMSNLLPEHMIRKSGLFPLDDHGRKRYLLSPRQNVQAGIIIGKLNREKGSDYMFSAELQRTYLIELMHLLVKSKLNRRN